MSTVEEGVIMSDIYNRILTVLDKAKEEELIQGYDTNPYDDDESMFEYLDDNRGGGNFVGLAYTDRDFTPDHRIYWVSDKLTPQAMDFIKKLGAEFENAGFEVVVPVTETSPLIVRDPLDETWMRL